MMPSKFKIYIKDKNNNIYHYDLCKNKIEVINYIRDLLKNLSVLGIDPVLITVNDKAYKNKEIQGI